jgi:hypothetical protein
VMSGTLALNKVRLLNLLQCAAASTSSPVAHYRRHVVEPDRAER